MTGVENKKNIRKITAVVSDNRLSKNGLLKVIVSREKYSQKEGRIINRATKLCVDNPRAIEYDIGQKIYIYPTRKISKTKYHAVYYGEEQ